MKHLAHFGHLRNLLKPGATMVLHSGCAEPILLSRLVARHAADLRGIRLLTMMPMGEAPYGEEVSASLLDVVTFMPGKGLRSALTAGRVTSLRHPISHIPTLFASGQVHADVLMLQVSPPDDSGHVSLGICVDYMLAVLAQSPLIVAEINPRMPRTCGETLLHVSRVGWYVDGVEGPQEMLPVAADEVDQTIASNVAGLVRDGAVIQLGIGSLPDCVMTKLRHLKHLGLHTGIVTDGVRELIESGVIDNSTKTVKPGVGITTMAGGTQSFYDYLDGNKAIEFYPCNFTHGAQVLPQIDGLCAINSALQVDLAGNVNAEEIGDRKISLPGGLPDFSAGAVNARGGLSIVAIRSTFGKSRISNIVGALPPPFARHGGAIVGGLHRDRVWSGTPTRPE